jgi:hypothetical protein
MNMRAHTTATEGCRNMPFDIASNLSNIETQWFICAYRTQDGAFSAEFTPL